MIADNTSALNENYLEKNIDNVISDIAALVEIPSVRDELSRSKYAPFGQPIRHAFDKLIEIATGMGLEVRDHDGYAIDISVGEGEEEIALLHHIDVVSAGDLDQWKTNPYQLVQKDGFIYGRGATDNKGPLVASLYILKMFKECSLPLDKKIRLIVGGAEETTWECIDHYFQHNPQPDYAFSPDGDFPIVNGEFGIQYSSFTGTCKPVDNDDLCQILSISSERDRTSTCHQLELTLSGKKAMEVAQQFSGLASLTKSCKELVCLRLETPWEKSRNPHNAVNCMDILVSVLRGVDYLDDNSKNLVKILGDLFSDSSDGSKLGLSHSDSDMGTTTCCVSAINMDQQTFNLDFDFRYPKGLSIETIRTRLQQLSKQYEVNLIEHQHLPLSYLSPESPLIQSMGKAYFDVTGMEVRCFSKRAASYARSLKNGVAFGPTFPEEVTNVHGPNEQLCTASLIKAFSIYVKVLISI